jgi:alpha 1,2-mannosyltransferase
MTGRNPDVQSALVRVTAYDPFLVMQDQGKVYGFTISLFEYIETIPSLWDSVKG